MKINKFYHSLTPIGSRNDNKISISEGLTFVFHLCNAYILIVQRAIKHLDNIQYALHIIPINTKIFIVVVNSLIAL